MTPQLRPYQQATLDALAGGLQAGHNRLLVKKPTGTGKTVTFAAMLEHAGLKCWLAQFPAAERKMLVIAHREELLDQAAEKIRRANPHARVEIEQADRHASRFADVVVASIQTLAAAKYRRLKRMIAQHTFRLVVVDEAHHAAAATYRTTLAHLGFLPMADASDEDNAEAATFDDVAVMEQALAGWDAQAPKDRLLVGVTATPNRSDAIGLGCVFQSLAYSYALKDAIADGWLVPIVPWVIETDTNLDGVKLNRGEFNQRELAEAVNVAIRNKLAVAGWLEHGDRRPTLAFTVDVAHAHALAAEFASQGVRARALSGETPREDRREILQQIREGQIDVITNCMVLTEGTDLPMVSCILHAKPTKSATLYEQMTGRGLRIHEGKSDCIVIDVVDVARRHALQAAPVLYGLPPGITANGKTLADLERAIEDFRDKYPAVDLDAMGRLTLAQLQAKATTFDVWKIPDMGVYGQGLGLKWIRTGETTFRLAYPWQEMTEALAVAPDLVGRFTVTLTRCRRDGQVSAHPDDAPRVIAANLASASEALALAESFVREARSSVTRLRSDAAPWRKNPASKGQIAFLRRLRVPFAATITSGEASDLIDLAKARGGR